MEARGAGEFHGGVPLRAVEGVQGEGRHPAVHLELSFQYNRVAV